MIYDKKKKKEYYDINTALGDNYADYAKITGERKKMTDGAEIYRGGDGKMYADHGGKTLPVRNNYKKSGIGTGANNALAAFYQSSVRRAGDGAYGGSEWDKRTRDLIDRALGLSYDDYAKSDAYKALAGRYAEQGKRAMDETAAQIAARTGGVASSYAAAAGQQQYNEYMRRLEEAARAQYDKARGDLIQNAGLAQQMGNEHYDRWLNEQRRQATERDTQMSIIREMLGNEESDLARALDADEIAYRRDRDAMNDAIIAEDRAISTEDRNRKIADASKKAAQDEVDAILGWGGEPSAELIAASGYTPEYIAAAKSAARSAQAKKTSSTRISGGSRSDGGGVGSSIIDRMPKGMSEAEANVWLRENGVKSGDVKYYYDLYAERQDGAASEVDAQTTLPFGFGGAYHYNEEDPFVRAAMRKNNNPQNLPLSENDIAEPQNLPNTDMDETKYSKYAGWSDDRLRGAVNDGTLTKDEARELSPTISFLTNDAYSDIMGRVRGILGNPNSPYRTAVEDENAKMIILENIDDMSEAQVENAIHLLNSYGIIL